MIEPTPPVAILMGSQSDWATLRHAAAADDQAVTIGERCEKRQMTHRGNVSTRPEIVLRFDRCGLDGTLPAGESCTITPPGRADQDRVFLRLFRLSPERLRSAVDTFVTAGYI
mgnify:CR=1 FL=1